MLVPPRYHANYLSLWEQPICRRSSKNKSGESQPLHILSGSWLDSLQGHVSPLAVTLQGHLTTTVERQWRCSHHTSTGVWICSHPCRENSVPLCISASPCLWVNRSLQLAHSSVTHEIQPFHCHEYTRSFGCHKSQTGGHCARCTLRRCMLWFVLSAFVFHLLSRPLIFKTTFTC